MRSTAGANLDRFGVPAIDRQLGVALWWSSLVLAVGVASLLFGRRLAGAFVEPLIGPEMLGAAMAIVFAAVFLQLAQPLGRLVLLIPAVAAALGLAAITLPGTAPWSVALAWFVLVIAEAAVLLHTLKHPRFPARSATPSPAIDLDISEVSGEESISERLIQKLTRERTTAGNEALHALVRATCPPGDRLAVVHLAFCPPLDAPPRLMAHVLDDSGAEAKITLSETYGTRIEVRLPRPAGEAGAAVLLEVVGEADINSGPDQRPASPPHRHP